MIDISNQVFRLKSAYQGNYTNKDINTTEASNKAYISQKLTPGRELLLEKMENLSREELDVMLANRTKVGENLMVIYLNGSLPDVNDSELMGRLDRAGSLFKIESEKVWKQENLLISQGRMQGETSKEILKNIIDLYDNQSELFKTGIGWNGKGISGNKMDTDGYAKLVDLTPDYVNYFV